MNKSTQHIKTLKILLILAICGMFVFSAALFIAVYKKSKAPSGSTSYTIAVEGTDRSYKVYVPADLPTTKAPLVVMLHGALGTADQAEKTYNWDAKADAQKFIVAYPNGLNRAWAVSNDCCGPPAKNKVNDVAFITKMIEQIKTNHAIDTSRIFATGISNGGALAYRLACDTDTFAAIGPVATTLLGDCPAPNKTSVIHIHGRDDETFPYAGGSGKRNNDGTGDRPINTTGPAIPDLNAMWRTIDSCATPTTTTAPSVTTLTAACADGRGVTLVSVDGAGHQWPGSQSSSRETLIKLDQPSTALSATDTIWDFFVAHPKP